MVGQKMKRSTPRRSSKERARLHEIVNRFDLPLPPQAYQKPKEFIYVTKADFGYKIGMTTRPKSRPLQVAGNCPIKLEVVVLLEVDNMRTIESRLHSHFASKHLRGEWFALTDEDIAFIKDYPKGFDSLPKSEDDDVPF